MNESIHHLRLLCFRPLTGNHLVNWKTPKQLEFRRFKFPSPYGESFSKCRRRQGLQIPRIGFRPLTGNHLVNSLVNIYSVMVKSFRPLTGNHLVNQESWYNKDNENETEFPSPYGESFSKSEHWKLNTETPSRSFRPLTGNHLVNTGNYLIQ